MESNFPLDEFGGVPLIAEHEQVWGSRRDCLIRLDGDGDGQARIPAFE